MALITYNRVEFLRANVPRIRALLHPGDELLILDNNSADGTPAFLAGVRGAEVRSVRVERQGLNVCRNAAVAEARHDHVAYIDDDAWPAPGWLAAYRESRDRWPGAALHAGRTELDFEAAPPRHLPRKFRYLLGAIDYGDAPRPLSPVESPGGGNMMVDRTRLGAPAPFDEKFDRRGTGLLNNGETELVERLRARGERIVYAPGAVIHHWASRERAGGRWLLRRAFYQGVSDGLVAAKRRRYPYYLARRLAFHFTRGPLETLQRWREPRALAFGLLLDASKTAGAVLAARRADGG
ncbi:MAG TPA: glycosyltransferase [Longimicrobium sp.]